jgi:hypothetical protein
MTTHQRFAIPSRLSEHHHRTYEAVFRQPPAHDLGWHDVRSLLDNLADMTESDRDSFRAMRDGQELVLHVPQYMDFVTAEDLLTVRRFLTQTSEPAVPAASGPAVVVERPMAANASGADRHQAGEESRPGRHDLG